MGSLLAFMYYNKTPAKIFMGDTGSLMIGLVLALLSIQFIESNKVYDGPFHITSVPAVTIAILIVPLFDLARVFAIRLFNGHSPMHPDRNHLHHRLLDLGFTHMQVAGTLSFMTAFFIAFAIGICRWRAELVLTIVLGLATVLCFWVEYAYQKLNIRNARG
jgi:UDP-GlcNAc:undecaprenyl-phosphate GlcNAc-1-phosphate transferase